MSSGKFDDDDDDNDVISCWELTQVNQQQSKHHFFILFLGKSECGFLVSDLRFEMDIPALAAVPSFCSVQLIHVHPPCLDASNQDTNWPKCSL
jgi:hypothetical protein